MLHFSIRGKHRLWLILLPTHVKIHDFLMQMKEEKNYKRTVSVAIRQHAYSDKSKIDVVELLVMIMSGISLLLIFHIN